MDIKSARNEREHGSLEKALEMFLLIDKTTLTESQLFDYYGELGLTYLLLKNQSLALSCYQMCQYHAFQLNNDSLYSVSLRHLSNPEFHLSKLQDSVSLAKEARELAIKSNRKDIVWFDQGIINSLSYAKNPKSEVSFWVSQMVRDLYQYGSAEKDETALWVWVTGYLIELSKNSENRDILFLALLIAEKFKLERRIDEIKKYLEIK